jgi:hypothetical protein
MPPKKYQSKGSNRTYEKKQLNKQQIVDNFYEEEEHID